jgi:TolA-binding protein
MRAFYFYPRFFLGFFVLSFAVSGCAQRIDEFEIRMKDMDERMKLMEGRSGGPVGSDRELLEGRKIADVRTQLSAMRNEITVMSGKLEALELELKSLREQTDNSLRDLDRKIGQQSSSGGAPNAPAPVAGGEAKYREALMAHQAGDFVKSRRLFEEFVKESPRSAFADNAVYWMGESYMLERDHRKALIRFDDLIAKFPNSDKRCDSRDRQIEALKALGMEDQAKTFADLRNSECKKR